MKVHHLIVVGKNKDPFFSEKENDYLKQIKDPFLKVHEAKSFQEDLYKEGKEVLLKIEQLSKTVKNPYIVLLSENGKMMDSLKFSEWLDKKNQEYSSLIFIIGGSKGHSEEVIQKNDFKLSLSPMTFPHKWARLLFVEQFFRSMTIKNAHPYHK